MTASWWTRLTRTGEENHSGAPNISDKEGPIVVPLALDQVPHKHAAMGYGMLQYWLSGELMSLHKHSSQTPDASINNPGQGHHVLLLLHLSCSTRQLGPHPLHHASGILNMHVLPWGKDTNLEARSCIQHPHFDIDRRLADMLAPVWMGSPGVERK